MVVPPGSSQALPPPAPKALEVSGMLPSQERPAARLPEAALPQTERLAALSGRSSANAERRPLSPKTVVVTTSGKRSRRAKPVRGTASDRLPTCTSLCSQSLLEIFADVNTRLRSAGPPSIPVLLLGLVFLLMYIWVITRGMSRSEKRRTEQLKRVAEQMGLTFSEEGLQWGNERLIPGNRTGVA